MIEQRPGQKVFVVPGPAWGVRVVQPAAPPADWWDPDNEGLSVVAAYRAINSAGTPWPGGPANYAESLVNQANPGVNDLTEGNGVVPWAAATGWGFVAAALQYFDTGLIPAYGWSALTQYANVTDNGRAFAARTGGLVFGVHPDTGGGDLRYLASGVRDVVPVLLTGNMGMAEQQGYRNGIADGAAILNTWGVILSSIWIGGQNNAGALQFPITGDIQSVVFYNATLTAPQVLAVATAMAAL